MECGQAFGCEILCGPIHSAIGVFSNEAPTEDEFKYGVETLQRAAEKAQARGIRMAIEYLNRFEIYFLTTAAQAARFVRAVDHPYCKMMYDSFHAPHRGEGPGPGHRVVCRRDDPRPRLGERPGHPRHRSGALGRLLPGPEAERIQRLSDHRGLRPGPPRAGRGHARSGATCSPTRWAYAATAWPSSSRGHAESTSVVRTDRPRTRVSTIRPRRRDRSPGGSHEPCALAAIVWAVVGLAAGPARAGPGPGDGTPAAAPQRHGAGQGPAAPARRARAGRSVGHHGRGRRRRHHPLGRQGHRDRPASSASTRRRSGGSSITCPMTSLSAPRRGRSPRGPSPPRPRSSCCARRPSIPTAAPWLTCSSTAGTTRSSASRPATRPRRSATTATTACLASRPRSSPPRSRHRPCPSSRRTSTAPGCARLTN